MNIIKVFLKKFFRTKRTYGTYVPSLIMLMTELWKNKIAHWKSSSYFVTDLIREFFSSLKVMSKISLKLTTKHSIRGNTNFNKIFGLT